MNNRDVAATLERIAEVLDVLGESSFRTNAYRNAGRRIESLGEDINAIAAANGLTGIPGVGAGLAATISDMLENGRSDLLEQISFSVPPGLLDLLTVPGFGPKKARTAHQALGITTLAELEAAARDGRLAGVTGFGDKTAANVLKALAGREKWASRRLPGDVQPVAEALLASLRSLPGVARAEAGGSLRRRKDMVRDLNLVAASDRPNETRNAFSSIPLLAGADESGRRLTVDGLPVSLEVTEPSDFGGACVRATGSRAHVERLEKLAATKGATLAGDREEAVYGALGLAWVPPELREDQGEIEAASSGRLPNLIVPADLLGDLHMHSRYSDGAADIRDMALACIERGYRYMAITDHSQGLGIANGLTPERLRQQAEEVTMLNAELAPFRILRGNEVDIRADGSMDFPEEVLERLDWVVASVHSAFGRSREDQTARVERAMRNPYVNVVAHPTGRILGRRDGIDVDIERLLEVAAETGTALEINSGPDRLDLDDVNARAAKTAGIPICIDADAHHPEQLSWVDGGVGQARRAWLEAGDVLNSRPVEAVQEFVSAKRSRAR